MELKQEVRELHRGQAELQQRQAESDQRFEVLLQEIRFLIRNQGSRLPGVGLPIDMMTVPAGDRAAAVGLQRDPLHPTGLPVPVITRDPTPIGGGIARGNERDPHT